MVYTPQVIGELKEITLKYVCGSIATWVPWRHTEVLLSTGSLLDLLEKKLTLGFMFSQASGG